MGRRRNASGLNDKTGTNPSSLSFFKDLARGLNISASIGYVIYILFALFVTSSFIWAIYRFNLDEDILFLVAFACIAYALAVPRMKDYSFILLLMPALMTIRLFVYQHWLKILMFFLLWIALFPYQVLAVTVILFVLILWGMRHTSRTRRMSPEPTGHGSGDG